MSESAAHLCDAVWPSSVPVRQWVLTSPSEVRWQMALRPEVLTAQSRIFTEEVAQWQKRHAKKQGID